MTFCHINTGLSFCHSVSLGCRRLNILKESKLQSKPPTTSFYQHYRRPSKIPIRKLCVIVVEVIPAAIETSLENLDTNLVLTRVQTLVQKILIHTLLIVFYHTMIGFDLAMINIREYLLHKHIILLVHTTTYYISWHL